MSSFYGQLAKDALGDEVSDVSEGELEKMLASMGDLDAGLFGSTSITKAASADKHGTLTTFLNKDDLETESPEKTKPPKIAVEESAPIMPKVKKSQLLAELFGSDDESAFAKPASDSDIETKNLVLPSNTKSSSIPLQGQENKSGPISYEPTVGSRKRQNIVKNKPIHDMWSEFLKSEPSPGTTKESPDILAIENSKEKQPEKPPAEIIGVIQAGRRNEIIQSHNQAKIDPSDNSGPMKLSDELIERVVSLVKEEQQKIKDDLIARMDQEFVLTKEENMSLKEEIANMHKIITDQNTLLEEIKNDQHLMEINFKEQMHNYTNQFSHVFDEFEMKQREKASYAQCQISQLEERVQDLQQLTDTMHPLQISMKERLSGLQTNVEKSQENIISKLERFREVSVMEQKKIKSHFEEKILKINSQAGDFELLEKKVIFLENKVAKLVSCINETRQEEELLKRLTKSEDGILQKLKYFSSQQIRQENWHQQQLSDVSLCVDQRLWGLHQHLEMTLSSCRGEISNLRSDMTNRLSDMEGKVVCAENETSRLSRLAERLCSLLQLWELRNKESAKIQLVAEQSLKERFSLIMTEKQLQE